MGSPTSPARFRRIAARMSPAGPPRSCRASTSFSKKAGTDKSKILFAQVWLKHVAADFAAMNTVWEDWVPEDALPARATVEANLAAENILVEIAVRAAVEA